MTEITCIVCPLGCRITAENETAGLKLSGYGCGRGADYARNEASAPLRMLTAVVSVAGSSSMLPVKTAAPIPKASIERVLSEIKRIQTTAPIKIGQTIKENLAGTGVALVATKGFSKAATGCSYEQRHLKAAFKNLFRIAQFKRF